MAINLSLSKLPWYGQIGVFVVIALAGAGAFWNFYARDVQESIDGREAQLAKLRVDIDRGLQTARRLPEFRREVGQLEAQLERLRAVLPEHANAETSDIAPDAAHPIRVAIVGRPNAGKSPLINRLIGEERLLTGPEAGITRGAISVEYVWAGPKFPI